MVAYPVHIVLLNAKPWFRRWLIDNGHTLVGFLPVEFQGEDGGFDEDDDEVDRDGTGNVVELDDFISHTSEQSGRILKLEMLHKSMERLMQPLLRLVQSGFEVQDNSRHVWNCFPLLSSYCCDIPEAKDMSCVKHGTKGPAPCIRCMSKAEDFETLTVRENRSISDTVHSRRMLSNLGTVRKEF